ncbi:hypothetical protein AUK22_01340 [bacterium CG2_30_54_10]|nr:MAG: hypothetical protein AUK22_01340 [bacterium CG2_30_54_10]
MSIFNPIFQALNQAQARYVVVGGIATILHGYVRATTHLDLMVDLHTQEVEKTIRALSGYGFRPRAPVDPLQFAQIPSNVASGLRRRACRFFLFSIPESSA